MHQRAVKGGGDRQGNRPISFLRTCRLCRCDGLGRSGQYPLVGAVDVGQHHIRKLFDQRLQGVYGCFYRQHGPRITDFTGLGHQVTAGDTQIQKGFTVDPTGGIECRQLPVTVSTGGIRPQVEVVQNRKHGQTYRTDGGLGHIGAAKGIRLLLLLVVGKGGARIKDFTQ